ncbi:hypothetical protein [Insolitispirillum peregrinum]|uniref:BstA-like C-terminal domain-containing protein n=1 Tax=Insolitispirillum peregrinum TaxID=80876 RepID=A0A1N7IHH7_9PROT|nr:hypothetical protein [Insolitispirillum peregrinum]SIS36492.1 hypothetical protein SAMN05421779_10115 [Insolitispirillum peregrinum]
MAKGKHIINPVKGTLDKVSTALVQAGPPAPKEISLSPNRINILSSKATTKEISQVQGSLDLGIEVDAEFGEIGMGVLSDGTPYLNQRGLAALCGVQNAHIGTISSQWNELDIKPRIKAIKDILEKSGSSIPYPHIEVIHKGRVHYCYPAEICLSILEYYAFDAGVNCQTEARNNFRLLAGSKLRELIYSQVGYDPSGAQSKRFNKWHERIALNYHSAPKGYFHVFNEAHTIIYELIVAGANIDEKFVVDISIGLHWSKYWDANKLEHEFGIRRKYAHRYPDDHPQAKSNPQESWCYPLASLGHYREWLQNVYLEGGKFAKYLDGKVKQGDLPPSIAQLAMSTLVPPQIEGPKQ